MTADDAKFFLERNEAETEQNKMERQYNAGTDTRISFSLDKNFLVFPELYI